MWGGRLHTLLMRYLADAEPDVLCRRKLLRTPSARSGSLTWMAPSMTVSTAAKRQSV